MRKCECGLSCGVYFRRLQAGEVCSPLLASEVCSLFRLLMLVEASVLVRALSQSPSMPTHRLSGPAQGPSSRWRRWRPSTTGTARGSPGRLDVYRAAHQVLRAALAGRYGVDLAYLPPAEEEPWDE